MTTTQSPPQPANPAPAASGRTPGPSRSRPGDGVLATATATVAAGMFLTTLPLSSIFTDWSWLFVSIGCALPYLIVVGLLRYLGAPRWWHSAIGLLASVLMLLWVFVPQHLSFGVIPTPSAAGDIGDLIRQARQSMQDEHAPLASTPALRLLVASALVALAGLTDILGVLLRRPLLAAAPLLEVLAVASATSSRSANPVWFAAAAIGFLLILLSGTRLQDRAWGPSVDGSAGRLGGGRRMAATGILAALIVPLLLPSVPSNLLARAAHHNTGGDGTGSGNGQVVLNGLASLRGSLQRPTPAALFDVQVSPSDSPFYIRQDVDEVVTKDGWAPAGNALGQPQKSPVSQGNFEVSPELRQPPRSDQQIKAQFTIRALGGNTLPILAVPTALRTSGNGTWNSDTASVFDVALKRNFSYTEDADQPNPTQAQLRTAPDWSGSGDPQLRRRYLALPTQSSTVVELANRLTAGLTGPYAKARAISDYFTNGKNGFSYSLSAPANDGRAALDTFLDKKQGFCQQYAAAAGVLMRQAGLPTRVVVGYTHRAPNSNGEFTVSTSDAHAWVEVYMDGLGWIPFDPTPFTLTDSTRSVPLAWATHPATADGPTAEPTANTGGVTATASSLTSSGPGTVTAGSGPIIPAIVWQVGLIAIAVLLLIAAVVAGPRLVRRRQRRRRLDRARHTGNPEPLWLELAATAADRNALWPATVTVGQVATWLGRHGVDERGRAAVAAVADTVARDRFSSTLVTQVPPESITALDQALTRWSRRTDRRLSLLNRWVPKSLRGRHPRWQR